MANKPTIVLVHGFWGGAAHWAKVISLLHAQGFDKLYAVENPLTSLADDAERTRIYEDVNRRFASEGYSLWKWWTLWDIGTAPNVYGILGPDLPDGGGKPFRGLAGGYPVTSMWIGQ